MKFSYNWLQSFFRKKLPKSERLAELLTRHSFETTCQKPIVKSQGSVLDIDVLPNRGPDCFSHLGIAQEIAAIMNYELRIKNYELKEDENLKAEDFVSVEVKNKNACSRYTARVITNVKVCPSPRWIRERLGVCGLKSINNIVDIANYLMLETGQPLHAFDLEKLEGRKLIIRFAKEKEKIVTLDEEKYDLAENILVIADAEKPVAIAGIKGGKGPEIDEKTKIVVLESANFNPRIIRRGSKLIDLKTDASWRFEHGLDPKLTELAINRAASLIQEIAQGKVSQGLVDFYPQKVLPKIIKLDLDYVEKLLGIKIPEMEIKKILERLGFKVKSQKSKVKTTTQKSKVLEVEVPTRRLDISIPEDLIEEIGRIYGYEKIPSTFPIASLIPPKINLDIFWEEMAKNVLKEAGFSEVYNYSFISEKEAEIFKYSLKELIEIENPTSLDFRYLRPSLIPNLLKNIQKNLTIPNLARKNLGERGQFSEIKIFELGKTFSRPKTPEGKPSVSYGAGKNQNPKIIEKRILTGVITGDNFYQAKGVVDLLLNKLGISSGWYDEYQPTPEETKISIWHLQRCAEIKINDNEIGFLGEIKPAILENLKIEQKIVLFDIDFEKLIKLTSEEQEYRPISRFPAAVRDLALLVPRLVRVEEVLNKIETAAGPLIRDIDLFDIYDGEEIPGGKKNLAFHLIFQAEDRTLSSEEIDEIQQKIIKALEEESEWQARK